MNLTLVVDRSGSMDIRSRLGTGEVARWRCSPSRCGPTTPSRWCAFEDTVDAGPAADAGRRQRGDPGCDRQPAARRQHQPGRGPRLRLRAGPVGVPSRRHQRRRALLRRRRQRRHHRPRRHRRDDRRAGPQRHPPGDGRLRHGQLQRPPDGAARRPGRRLLPLRRHLRGGRARLRRRADLAADAGRRRRAEPGGVRPGAGHVVPPGRLRQPRDGRRVVRGPQRRRRRARRRPPGDRALRGAAGRRRRARARQIGTATVRGSPPATRAPGSAEAPVLAADPEAAPSDSFALATAAADLAELVKLGGYDADHESDIRPGAPRRTPASAPASRRSWPVPCRARADLLALVDGCERGSRGY